MKTPDQPLTTILLVVYCNALRDWVSLGLGSHELRHHTANSLSGIMQVTVTKAYTSQYSQPICFEANVTVQVERADSEYPGWFWCRAPSGREGWVHRSFLAAGAGTTTSVRAYSARELNVRGGERGTLVEHLAGWVFIRLETGEEGWLPEIHIQIEGA